MIGICAFRLIAATGANAQTPVARADAAFQSTTTGPRLLPPASAGFLESEAKASEKCENAPVETPFVIPLEAPAPWHGCATFSKAIVALGDKSCVPWCSGTRKQSSRNYCAVSGKGRTLVGASERPRTSRYQACQRAYRITHPRNWIRHRNNFETATVGLIGRLRRGCVATLFLGALLKRAEVPSYGSNRRFTAIAVFSITLCGTSFMDSMSPRRKRRRIYRGR